MRKKQIHKEKEVCQFKQKLRLSSCSTVSWNFQSCGVTDLSVDQHLDHINTTTPQRNMVDACTGLATYSAAHLCYACCLCVSFLFSCGRPLVGEGAHPHISRLISVSLVSPLRWRRAGESAHVQVLWVSSRSVTHAPGVWRSDHP